MSNRVINLNPTFTDIIKLAPKEREIFLNKDKLGLYLQLDWIDCNDIKLNSHKRVLNGSYISQYSIEKIRVRNHYPHMFGRAWNKQYIGSFNEYLMKDQGINGKALKLPINNNNNIYNRINQGSYDFGIYPQYYDTLTSGNVWLDDPAGVRCVNQCCFKEKLFCGYKNGVSFLAGQYGFTEHQYYAMYYSYQSPNPPLDTNLQYYYDTMTGNVGDWVDATIHSTTRKWEIIFEAEPFYSIGGQNFNDPPSGDMSWLYGAEWNTYKYDARVQALEFQILTTDGKIGTRLYYIFHIPQSIPKMHVSYDYENITGANNFTNGDPYGWEIIPASYIFDVNVYSPEYNNVAFVTHGTTNSKLVPLPFPLNTNYINKQISVSTSIPSLKTINIYHPAIKNSISITGFTEIEYDSSITPNENEFYVSDYDVLKLKKEGYENECGSTLVFNDANIGDNIAIVYNTPVIDKSQIVKVVSVIPYREFADYTQSPYPNRPLLDGDNVDGNFYTNYKTYALQDIIAYNQYFLYCEDWFSNTSATEYWIILDVSNSDYLPCGSGFEHYCRLTTNGVKGYATGELNILYTLGTRPGDPANAWVQGYYVPFYTSELNPLESLCSIGDLGFTDPEQAADYLYENGRITHSASSRETPVEQPADPVNGGWYRFFGGSDYGYIEAGIYGFCNDGQQTRAFINCTQTSNNTNKKTTFTSDFNAFDMIFLPLINLQNPPSPSTPIWAFGMQPDTRDPIQYILAPNPLDDGENARGMVLNSISLANGSAFNSHLSFGGINIELGLTTTVT